MALKQQQGRRLTLCWLLMRRASGAAYKREQLGGNPDPRVSNILHDLGGSSSPVACLGAEQVLEVAQVAQLPAHDQPVRHAASLRALPAVGAAPAPRLAAEALPTARAAAHIQSSSHIVDMKERCTSELKHDKSMQACKRAKCSTRKCMI